MEVDAMEFIAFKDWLNSQNEPVATANVATVATDSEDCSRISQRSRSQQTNIVMLCEHWLADLENVRSGPGQSDWANWSAPCRRRWARTMVKMAEEGGFWPNVPE